MVLTTGSTIAYGGHFFTAPHIVKSVGCLVLALFTEHWTTNTSHLDFFRVVLRFLPAWFRSLTEGAPAEGNYGERWQLDRTMLTSFSLYIGSEQGGGSGQGVSSRLCRRVPSDTEAAGP